jgi:GNAT superfamily N-acetyltransferase
MDTPRAGEAMNHRDTETQGERKGGNPLTYSINPPVSVQEFVDVLNRSGLGARRPVHDPERIGRMLQHANLTVCAYDGVTLVGIARALADFAFCCYLSDLAVDRAYQRRGIGRELVRRIQEAIGPESMLLLLSAPDAMDYYSRIGFQKVENGWILDRRK